MEPADHQNSENTLKLIQNLTNYLNRIAGDNSLHVRQKWPITDKTLTLYE